MPGQHQNPAVIFRPDPQLHQRAKTALDGTPMQAYLVEALRYLVGDVETLERPTVREPTSG